VKNPATFERPQGQSNGAEDVQKTEKKTFPGLQGQSRVGGLGGQAKLLGISRGSVYYLPKPVSEYDLDIRRRLDELHLKHPFMGARQLRDQLNRQGIQIGRKRVKTLMMKMGIEALYCKPNTSKKTPGHEIHPYLLRGMTIRTAPIRFGPWIRRTSHWPKALRI